MKSLVSAAAVVTAFGLVASAGRAQVFNWNNSAGGLWSVGSNWTPDGPPNAAGHTAILSAPGTYAVDTGGIFTVADLSLPNANVTLNVNSGTALNLAGTTHTNDGLVMVNDTAGGNGTYLRLVVNATLSGTGQWRVMAHPANLDTGYIWVDGVTLTQASNHTISGTGRLIGAVVNNGLIRANVSGRTLQLDSGTKTNNGTMAAENGGTLLVQGGTINQGAAGLIQGTTGLVAFSSTTVNGGRIEASAPGVAEFRSGCVLSGVRTGGQVDVPEGGTVFVSGGHVNDALWRVNPAAGGSGTFVRFEASGPLSGVGTMLLSAHPANLDTAMFWALGGTTITHGAGHTVRGTGRVSGNMINNGTFLADQSGRTLRFDSGSMSNASTLMATNAATLLLAGYTVVNTGPGQIVGNGGTVEVQSSSVTGGFVSGMGGTPVRFTGNSTIANLTLAGDAEVPSGSALFIPAGTGLTNNGTLTINPSAGGSGTLLRCDVDTLLAGPGTLALMAHEANLDTAYLQAFGATVTQAATHTIRGTGRIIGPVVNNGTILADVPSRTLRLDGGTKTNNAMMRATNGGLLQFLGGSVVQGGGGQIRADGGTVEVLDSGVEGGQMVSAAGSVIRFTGYSTIRDLTLSGASEIPSGSALFITAGSGLTNNGTLTINPSAGGSGTYMRCDVNTLLDGNGTLALLAHPTNLDTAYLHAFGATVTNALSHTIRGTGRLIGPMVNDGVILADVPSRTLRLDTGTKTNNAMIRTQDGATLQILGGSVVQGINGQILAFDGTVEVQNSSITGGLVGAVAPSTVLFTGSTAIAGVRLSGDSQVPSGSALFVSSAAGFENNGTLSINPAAGGAGTFLRFDAEAAVGGSGSIVLGAHPANFDTSYIATNGPLNITFGTAQAVRGRGRFHGGGVFTLRGPIDPSGPGTDIGRLEFIATTPTLVGTSAVHITVNGAGGGEYDTIAVSGRPMTFDGVVVIDQLPAYIPAPGTTLPIITTGTGNSGTFYRVVNGVTGAPDLVWRLQHLPSGVNLIAVCIADFTADGSIDFNDFLAFLNLYNLGHEDADLNDDGAVDFNDFLVFLNHFNAGC